MIKKNIDAFTSQKIATRAFKAFEKLMFKQGKEVHFKKYGEMYSVEGKSNSSGIRYKDGNAFLLMNCKNNLDEIDRDMCYQNFEQFRSMHDLEIKRLRIKEKTPFSMGV